jgi:hypothetical protein
MRLRAPMKSGDEFDALTKKGKRFHAWRGGQRKAVKRAFNRRERKWLDKVLAQ